MAGSEQAKHRADMLLANFVTKIFHNNADPETNRWAADTIGRSLQRRATYSRGETIGRSLGMSEGENTSWGSSSGIGGSSSGTSGYSSSWNSGSSWGGGENSGRNRSRNLGETVSDGFSETMDYEIEPAEFGRYLSTGGPENSNTVTAIWFQAGKCFIDSDRNYLFVSFAQ